MSPEQALQILEGLRLKVSLPGEQGDQVREAMGVLAELIPKPD